MSREAATEFNRPDLDKEFQQDGENRAKQEWVHLMGNEKTDTNLFGDIFLILLLF